jgi:hypothetical protein
LSFSILFYSFLLFIINNFIITAEIEKFYQFLKVGFPVELFNWTNAEKIQHFIAINMGKQRLADISHIFINV